jgi:regulatory protein
VAGRRVAGGIAGSVQRRSGGGFAAGPEPEDEQAASPPADPTAVARDICLRQLTLRPRSRAELAGILRRKGTPDDVAERVLDRLVEVGLLDDTAFAEMVVQSGHRHRSLGRRALSAELRRKGVADDTAAEAVAAIDSDDEESAARGLVERKLRSMPALDEPARIRRLMGMLARRGYPQGLAYRVIRDALREEGSATELPDPEHVT